MNDTELLNRLESLLGPADVRIVRAGEGLEPALTDWRGRFHGQALALLQPAGSQEVAEAVRCCAALGIRVVPQGGNTGLCGGATPVGEGPQVVLSLARLNRIRHIDLAGAAMTVEAGCILQVVQQAAADAGRLFPLSFAAEGSAQVGGALATNAGGTAVLKYGTARELVLGLEVVLADGRIWNGLRSLRKDNTGYDLRHLFMGSEGSLGIITAATLKLFPAHRHVQSALVAVGSAQAAIDLLAHLGQGLGSRLSAFEVFDHRCLDMSVRHHPALGNPFSQPHAWYALVELVETSGLVPLQQMAEAALEEALESGCALDVVLATSGKQRDALWSLRESISESQKLEGFVLKHDIAVPVAAIPAFLEAASRKLAAQFPAIGLAPFGHFGDGNIHFNVKPDQIKGQQRPAGEVERAIAGIVYEEALALGGSFSAEHGIGQLKTAELQAYKSPEALDLFRRLKNALDPLQLLNPGKVLSPVSRDAG